MELLRTAEGKKGDSLTLKTAILSQFDAAGSLMKTGREKCLKQRLTTVSPLELFVLVYTSSYPVVTGVVRRPIELMNAGVKKK